MKTTETMRNLDFLIRCMKEYRKMLNSIEESAQKKLQKVA